MANKLKAITTKAKALYKSGKYSKWTDAIKAASKSVAGVAPKKKPIKKAAVKKVAAKKSVSKMHKDTKSHNVNVSVVSGVGAKPQAGAIRNVYMKRNLRKAGFSVPTEIATNDLQKIYKSVFGKQPITIAKIKVQLKKGVAPSDIINK